MPADTHDPDDKDDYVPAATDPARIANAKKRLLDLLEEQNALVKPEAVTRLAETYYRGDPKNIDPHVTGQAIAELTRDRQIILTSPSARAAVEASARSSSPTQRAGPPQSTKRPDAKGCSTRATSGGQPAVPATRAASSAPPARLQSAGPS